MKFKFLITTALLCIQTTGFQAQADVVKEGDLSVIGGTCLGFDCISGESFANGALKLKENNVRIRLTNTEVAKQTGAQNVLGESWNIQTNSAANGGPAYLGFQVKSVNPDNLLSDGTANAYDCNDLATTKYHPNMVPVIGKVPVGEPFFIPQVDYATCDFGPKLACFHTCEANTRLKQTAAYILTFGQSAPDVSFGNSVAIGFNPDFASQPENSVVALGYNDLKRQLLHVATALQSTDALNVQGLKFTRVEAMLAQLTQLNAQLDVLETRIDEYEDSLTVKVDMGVDGTTSRLDLTKKNQLIITDAIDFGQWGPKGITFGFSSVDGHALNGIEVLDSDGNSYDLNGWWSVIDRPLGAEPITLLLPEQPGRVINVQWWYSW